MKRSQLIRHRALRRSTKAIARQKPLAARPRAGWQQARRTVRDRANGRCEARLDGCAVTGCHAHHILMLSQGGPDDPANLLWVCSSCHRWIHDHPADSYRLGHLRRRDTA